MEEKKKSGFLGGLFGGKKKNPYSDREQKSVEECREHFLDQEFELTEKMLQPNDKIHLYKQEDLEDSIKEIYENLVILSKQMDEVLDYTSHLPNFRYKCKVFIQMSGEIDKITMVILQNLKSKGNLSDITEFEDLSERVKESISQLQEELGEIKEEDIKSVHLFNELSSTSFKLSDSEIKKILEENKNEDDPDEEEKIEVDSEDEADPLSMKEVDEAIFSRVDDLVRDCDNITKQKRKRDEKLFKSISKGEKEVCIPAVTMCYKNFCKMLKKITDSLDKAVDTKKNEYLREFVSYASKMPLVGDILFGALTEDSDCIYYKDLDDEDWDLLFSAYDYEKPSKLKNFMSQYHRICEFMAYLSAVIGREDYSKGNPIFNLIKSAKWAAYYALFKKKRNQQFNLFMSNPDVDAALKVYNLQDTLFLQDAMKYILPQVKLHKVIYVPMLLEPLSLPFLSKMMKNYEKGGRAKEKNFPVATSDLDTNFERFSGEKYDSSKYVKVRIFSNTKFPVNWDEKYVLTTDETNERGTASGTFNHIVKDTKKKVKTVSCGCCGLWKSNTRRNTIPRKSTRDKLQIIEIPAIVIHIHGGGFVSMSSQSHQAYTRQWTVDTGIPIFSIDYRLAPEDPYPAALNDVWQVYYWVVTYCKSKLGISPAKVFVTGDSAGGNLTYTLTNLAIASGFRVPDMIMPQYPAMVMGTTMFSPSLLLAVDDFILPAGFLLLCIKSYVEDADPEHDPFLSPAVTPDYIIDKYPAVRLMIAGNDPLRDESYKYVLRMLKRKVDVKMHEYQMFPHAFLNFDAPLVGIGECEYPIKRCSAWLQEFANKAYM
ncbi:unnamed protein product [Moneuplotes crassus]|uniref:Alpha/beta hydrolase fold-3 domain-containing protein n=1 Tax=Euplotes crassus TaxID=5936 RepID=A0AAD1Y5Q0_EUPCR|nr:unnamed protein product [Moneuplotes crassus]